jgi:hypothetical protein
MNEKHFKDALILRRAFLVCMHFYLLLQLRIKDRLDISSKVQITLKIKLVQTEHYIEGSA